MLTDLSPTNTLETEHIKILYYDFNSKIKANYSSKNYIRFCSILDGSKNVKINEHEKIKYDSSSFIILTPFSKVEMDIEEKTRAFVMEIDNDFVHQIYKKLELEFDYNKLSTVDNNFYLGEYSKNLSLVHKKIVDIYNREKFNREFLIDLYSQELIYEMLKYKGADMIINDKNSKINKIIEYMNDKYLDSLKISEVAKHFNMKEYEFSRYFKKFIGKSPKEYIKELKLNKAKELLKFENVTDACYDVGYENISYFIKEFKEKFGVTPKSYKRNLLINTQNLSKH